MKKYTPKDIEAKWQDVWDKTKVYEVTEDTKKTKIYASPMLPYPSGTGLHVGHVRNYSIADVVARFYRQKGFNVMSNMGWDSFGLPAENYAIETGTPPWESTTENIKRFKEQLKRLGISYDWSREVNTSDPSFYKWTQWIFNQLFENGLAYQAEREQWWCPVDNSVLANEQVVDGKCWRHEDTPVEKKLLKQWFFKITEYSDDLLEGLEDLDWPTNIKTMQENWIGKSLGAEVDFKVEGSDETLTVFTTRPDTLFGATYMVLAPEHPLVKDVTSKDQKEEVEKYVNETAKKTDLDRKEDEKDKTGIFTGGFAVNPVNDERIPIWIADYVLMGYGTGAIMAVPAHDERDHEFAEKYELEIRDVIEVPNDFDGEVYAGEGKLVNSGDYSGDDSSDAREKIVADLQKEGLAKEKTNYRIHDWLISRQRYWGAPIPIIHCEKCGSVAVPDKDLPVELPKVENFESIEGNTSVLAEVDEWVNVKCPECDGPAKRETDTMDGYACSSWYLHRYTDANNDKLAWDPEKLNYWFPLDFYFGGDHAVSHLLYVRFWNRFFVDQGFVDKEYVEPIKQLVFNGYINAEDGSKMSKSKGNVVDPLDIIDSGYGADSLRLFELFVGPYDQDVSWNTNGVPGTHRFLQKVWHLVNEFVEAETSTEKSGDQDEYEVLLKQALHRTIKKVTDGLDRLSFNTAIAALMEFNNTAIKIKEDLPLNSKGDVWQSTLSAFVQLLAPFAPHISEELWQLLGYEDSVHVDNWPNWDEELVKQDLVTIVVQVNGKVRANLEMMADVSEDEMVEAAKKDEKVASYLSEGDLVKTVTVPGKLVNFVVKT